MSATYTRQTPSSVTAWLEGRVLQFREDWKLYEVADDCYRRTISKLWSKDSSAVEAVVGWATHKLATNVNFTKAHWSWIVVSDWNRLGDGYSRMIELLKPAIALDITWRKSPTELAAMAKVLDAAASVLLKHLGAYRPFNIQLIDVGVFYAKTQPLVNYSNELSEQLEVVADRAFSEAFNGGNDPLAALAAARGVYQHGYRAPTLAHYLQVLKASLTEGVPGTDFGEFGSHLQRKTILRRAVIVGFLSAVTTRRTKPKTTPACLIEAACTAWFGGSPTQQEINVLIATERARLWPEMLWEIAWATDAKVKWAQLVSSGMSEVEAERRVALARSDALTVMALARLAPEDPEDDDAETASLTRPATERDEGEI